MSDRESSAREAFAHRLTAILNAGALNLALAIGYRAGLFEALDALPEPATAEVIAARAGLSARYVREWLGVMTCGGILEIAPGADGQDCFRLPRAHADLLTHRAGPANLGVYTQEIPLLTACAMEAVLDGFVSGKGVPYAHYPRFQHFMAQLADAKHRRVLVDRFLPVVEGGTLVVRLKEGLSVCDVGCAQGVALALMAEAFPASRFVGIDMDAAAIEAASSEASRRGLTNVSYLCRDAADLAADPTLAAKFDYVTAFDAIHDQTCPQEALRGAYTILKPGGRFSMVDIAAGSRLADNLDHPMGPFLYTVSLMHCLPVGLVDGGAGLGMMWGRERAVALLEETGFRDVLVETIPDDAFNLHYLARK